MSVQLDYKRFHRRARYLIAKWKNDPEAFQNAEAIAVIVGDDEYENPYMKSLAIQTWLIGMPLYSSMIVITPDKITFVCGQKKADIMETLKQGDKQIPIDIIRRGKDVEENVPLYQSVVEALNNKRVGVFVKDKFKGKNINEWQKATTKYNKNYEEVDVSAGISACLAEKDEEEVRHVKTAAKISANMMQYYFTTEMSTLIDEEKPITNEKLSEMTENALDDPKLEKRLRLPPEVQDKNEIDWCYSPIVQSGGKFDLRSSASSNNDKLFPGAIICSLGIRYKFYCSNIGRTFLIDPSKTQEKNYEFLMEVQDRVLNSIREGVKMREVYQKAISFIKSKRPDLESHFIKNVGFGMGIEFREANYVLSGKNARELKNGMILNVQVGFADLENPKATDPRGKTYALMLVDTVRVTQDVPIVLTADCSKKLNKISYFFDDEEDKMDVDTPEKKAPPPTAAPAKRESSVAKTAILRSKLRNEDQEEESREQRRREHQKQLFAQKLAEGLAKFSESSGNGNGEEKPVFRKFESYRSEAKLPREVRGLKIVIDKKHDSIILPIYGMAVPFHISTLKNASKSDEGDYVMLRLNFLTPGQAGGKREDMPFDDANATFVRSLTFRSADTYRMGEIYRGITDMKKEATKKEAERREMADVVEQDNLVMVKGRRPHRLSDVYVRPQTESKRLPGELEIHQNGLRYQSIRSDSSFNVLFSNVKHLFFQPCDNELLVLIHIHFKNPILIGKKKTKDIQFYREASDIQFDETGNKRRNRHLYGDEDELEMEQEERRRRANLNKEFKQFAEKIAEASDGRVELDVPFRELGFQGVPNRSNVLLQPTTDCLVHLSDPPFLCITLNEVELAHLERVQFGLKNFDMVFVFKDYHRPPVHINTIPMSQLDNVKDWLDSVEVAFTEGPVNLNWSMIMKTVNEDTGEFFRNEGWDFLRPKSDEENSDVSESGSEFELSDDGFEESSSDDDDSEANSNASDESEEEEEMTDSGEDWDELEENARKADERKMKRSADYDDDAPSRKKRK
ncbi:FACT complex subunit-domain-containing protein [Gilbertella persicaria]|uniref:FACT complex subunit-domain-containing protein n=1 Tax=Gilbertella persicaria TaxID=101096 RepID=UPI0022212418|nr:FACT complex subunit-domain-containing protein [Gilbertella persicaria]KAI8062799.1 FACT complex subunit-domain-containing protein [Gilbertella persicaria]